MIVIKDDTEVLSYIEDIDKDLFKILDKQLSCFIPGYQFLSAFRAGMHDGKKRFYKMEGKTIYFPKGLASLVANVLRKKGYECTYKKTSYNDDVLTEELFNKFVDTLNLKFPPRDYQLKAALESIQNYRQINQMATGSGKSFTQFLLARYFLSKGFKVVILVPRVMLVEQMYSDFKDYNWDNIDDVCVKIGGDNKVKSFDSPLTISTWQSLMTKPDIFADVDVLMIDECHGSASSGTEENVYERVIFKASEGARFRLGFTGTIPKEAVSKMSLLGSIGPVVKYISTRDLIDMGLATPVEIKFLFFDYSDADKNFVKKLKYQDEVKFFNSHKNRNKTLAKVINKVSNSGNTIVLVDNVSYGEELAAKILEVKGIDAQVKELKKADNHYGIYLINGSTKSKERDSIRTLLEDKNGCILIGTSSILSTGINIKNLHNLFLTAGGKSFIQLNQAVGRLLRTHHSKDLVKIWDIVDDACIQNKRSKTKNHRYLHFEERLPIYSEHEYEMTEMVIKIRED